MTESDAREKRQMIPHRLKIKTLLFEVERYREITSILLTVVLVCIIAFMAKRCEQNYDLVVRERNFWEEKIKFHQDKEKHATDALITIQEQLARTNQDLMVFLEELYPSIGKYDRNTRITKLEKNVEELQSQLKHSK